MGISSSIKILKKKLESGPFRHFNWSPPEDNIIIQNVMEKLNSPANIQKHLIDFSFF